MNLVGGPGGKVPGSSWILGFFTNHNRYQEKERVCGNANAEQHDLTHFHRILTFVKLFALHKIVSDCFLVK
jgi:hypothetical protein